MRRQQNVRSNFAPSRQARRCASTLQRASHLRVVATESRSSHRQCAPVSCAQQPHQQSSKPNLQALQVSPLESSVGTAFGRVGVVSVSAGGCGLRISYMRGRCEGDCGAGVRSVGGFAREEGVWGGVEVGRQAGEGGVDGGRGIANAFFNSLERYSCVALSVTDSDDEDGEGGNHRACTSRFGMGLDKGDHEGSGIGALRLVGCERFVRSNPKSDRFGVQRFHHIEFWCGDASNTWRRFSWGLGMHLVAKSDQTTGNQTYCSYACQSNELLFTFTAPYSSKIDQTGTKMPHPGYRSEEARRFIEAHGLAVRAVGVLVDDADEAHRVSVENGAVSVLEPHVLTDDAKGGKMVMAEVKLYGDVVLRYVSKHGYKGAMLPNYEEVESLPLTYGLVRLDHAVGNVHKLAEAVNYIAKFSGFHEFAEFTADDVGTTESGLNSMVLASNNEMVLLPINEPTFGTKRKSQIQTYLEHNEGPGLQHLALICDDIFSTLREMRTRTHIGGFDFMPKPPPTYYKNLASRVGSVLTEEQIKECDELGILVDKDDQGVLLQIFTKPLGDRPTIFIEIIQRVGCMEKDESTGVPVQKGGCGGFGKGNFSELFKSIEEYEKTLDGTLKA